MSIYKSFQVRGAKRYMKDGRLISQVKVPSYIQKVLESTPEFDADAPVVERSRDCIFCGEHTNLSRLVNLQSVAICEEHYYSETIGKIAQKLNENLVNAKT